MYSFVIFFQGLMTDLQNIYQNLANDESDDADADADADAYVVVVTNVTCNSNSTNKMKR